MKRLVLIMLTICALFLAACGRTAAPTSAPTAQPKPSPAYDYAYVSLGDSIAWGYGLAEPESECYCYLLGETLSQAGHTAAVYRSGVNGDTSTDLLELLRGGAVSGLAGADLVTVSIGANNILKPAIAFLRDYAAYEDGGSLTAAQVTESFSAFLSAADAGVEALRDEQEEIVSLIRQAAPNARIVWLTVYNPYRDIGMTFTVNELPIQFEALSRAKVEAANTVIREQAQALGYVVADVFAAFEEDGGVLVNAGEGVELFSFLLDPHPNAAGHRLIAETVRSVL